MALGINSENLESVLEKLQNAIGKEWVSNDPAVLTCYSRDFTIVPGRWPHIVAIPGSTEDVQKIVKIANEHKVPVVPMGTGFNHGGLCVPLHGGIMLDLAKRMDKVLSVDEESMTITLQVGVRNAVTYAEANNRYAVDDIRLMVPLPLTMGSASTLANYVARGGAATIAKHANSSDCIINMTWVLPDGEVLQTGPSAVPGVGLVPVAYGPGPDIAGMFVNASGMFGICTEMTIKMFPERKIERMYAFDAEVKERTLEKAVEFIYKICQLDIVEMVYKSHGGQVVTMSEPDPENPFPLGETAEYLPENPVFVILAGDTEEELDIKEEILLEVAGACGLYQMDLGTLAEAFGGMDAIAFARPNRSKIGKVIGRVMHGRGAFQWFAACPKLEYVPKITSAYLRYVDKYWKPTDPEITRAMTFAGTAIQGPFTFARTGTLEFDFWWDQSNPEPVKRAQVMLRKACELFLKHGAPLWRNMYRFGELHLPRLGVYYDILKAAKKEFDPDNLMHPDIEPVTDDYI